MSEAVEARRPGIGILGPSDERLERLGAWYAAEHERLIRFAYVLTHDNETAEDLVQEAFVKMYAAGARLEEAGLGGYARQTILNLARSGFRRRALERRVLARMRTSKIGHDPDHAPGIDLRDALLRLSVTDRAALALRHYEGRTDREVADMLGISEPAAKKRVERAQARLRALLSEEEA